MSDLDDKLCEILDSYVEWRKNPSFDESDLIDSIEDIKDVFLRLLMEAGPEYYPGSQGAEAIEVYQKNITLLLEGK